MKPDADDFSSSRLVGWLDANGTEAGYLIRYGWLRDHHVAAQRQSSKVCRPIFEPRIRAAHDFFRRPHVSSQFRQHGWRHWRSHSQVQLADVPGSYSADKIHHAKFRKEFMLD